MWAAVLIPMWLRNHDTATENRSAERFGQAMRVLSRKGAPVEPDPEATPVTPGGRVPDAVGAVTARTGAAARRVAQASVAAKQRRRRAPRVPLTLVQRRARTLGVLVGLTFVTALLAIFTALTVLVMLPFVGLLGAFVVHLRIQARQQQQRRTAGTSPRRPAAQRAAAEERPGNSHEPEFAAGEASDSSGVVQGPSRAVVVERKGAAGATASSDGVSAADDDDAWRPNPLPLPTYVTAPKAVRPIKVIDLTTPGAWTSGRLLDDDVAEEDLLAAQVAEDELDALLDQEAKGATSDSDDASRRAVND
jgi:hypothetical protein